MSKPIINQSWSHLWRFFSKSSYEETSLRTHRLQNFFRRPALLQRIQILEFGICDFSKNLWRISCLQPSCSSARRSLRVRTSPVFEISAQQRPNSRAGESCLKKFLRFFIGSNTLLRTLANYLDFGFWDPASANWRNWAGPMEIHTDSKPMSIAWRLSRLLTLKEINYFWNWPKSISSFNFIWEPVCHEHSVSLYWWCFSCRVGDEGSSCTLWDLTPQGT